MDGTCVSKKYWSFTLVETLVAIAVLLIAIVAPLSLAHKSLQSTSVTRDQLMAFYLAQDAIDYMKKIRDQNISDEALWTSRFPNCVRNQESNCVFTVDTSKGVSTAFNTPCPGDVCPLLNFDTVTGRYGYHGAWPASVYKRTIRVTPVVTNEEMDVAVTVEWQGGKLGGIYTAHQSMFNLLGNVCRDLSGNIDYTCSGAGGGSGSLCGDGALAGGEQCDGSLFNVTCSSLGYSGGTLSCNANCTANTSGCTSAHTTYALTVSKGGTGSGTVTSNPSGVNCGSDCSENYTSGTSVTLSATPAGGSTFSGWSGACSGSGSCAVTISTAKNVTATFNTTGPAPDTTAPTAPTNLAAAVVSASQINLSWTASTDAVGVTEYRVERCQGSGCTSFAQIGTPSATSYSNTGLTAGTTYQYRVRATDVAGNLSGYSNIVSATTQNTADTTAPSVPTGVNARGTGSARVEISWSNSTDNIGVTGYRVERCEDNDFDTGNGCGLFAFAQVGTPTSASYTDTSIAAQKIYRYRIYARDAAGNWSQPSSVGGVAALWTLTLSVSGDGWVTDTWYDPGALGSSYDSSFFACGSGNTDCSESFPFSGAYIKLEYFGTPPSWGGCDSVEGGSICNATIHASKTISAGP